MRVIHIMLGLTLLTAPARAEGQQTLPAAPPVTMAEGDALIAAARIGMVEYLRRRTPAAALPAGPEARALTQRKLPVAVTLRQQGRFIDTAVAEGSDIVHNTMAAAQKAMRSSRLPDRVTAAVLEGLTVEVEVLSPPQATPAGDLDGRYRQGLTALGLEIAIHRAWLTPSAQYVEDVALPAARQWLRKQIPPLPSDVSFEPQWRLAAANHFVQRPGERTLSLYRGKIPVGLEQVDAERLRLVAAAIAGRLLADQTPEGRYRVGDNGSLADHAWATRAIAGWDTAAPSAAAQKSLAAAMAFTARTLSDDDALRKLGPDSAAEAMAWLLLTPEAAASASADHRRRLREQLAAYVARFQDRNQPLPPVRTHAVVLEALRAGAGEPDAAVKAFAAQLGSRALTNALDVGWALRGGASVADRRQPAVLGDEAPLDARGGVSLTGDAPSTTASALALRHRAAQAQQARDDLARRARFLIQMAYRPQEAWSADDPSAWVGRVRSTPHAAAAELEAAAAALEALSAVAGALE